MLMASCLLPSDLGPWQGLQLIISLASSQIIFVVFQQPQWAFEQ